MCLLGSVSPGAVAVAMLLLFPCAFVKKAPGAVLGTVITVIIGLVCLADIFCQEYFLTALNTGILRLIKDTTPSTTNYFFSTFVTPAVFGRWRITACIALMVAAPFAARLKLPKAVFWIMLVPAVIGLRGMGNTPPGRLVTSAIKLSRQDAELEKTHQAAFTMEADTCTFRSARIVLVIGEIGRASCRERVCLDV